jgi:hypothetical protein
MAWVGRYGDRDVLVRNEYIPHPTQTTDGQFTNAGCARDAHSHSADRVTAI